ncbi:phosphotransferase, partial [Acinetobacter baumannii]
EQLDHLKRQRPILEYAIQWMFNNLPKVDDLVLVHGDYRIGNIMINGDQISGILDWEFTQWGDRREDLGWFTSKCWR